MSRFALRIFIAVALVAGAAQATFAEKRVALVIGNSAYVNGPTLANPVRDAKAVAEALRGVGFLEVTEGYNLTKPQFNSALKRFGDAAASADWALIFFAGHGIAVGGETYLLPVDAVLARSEHADDEAVSLSRVRAKASGAKALRLIILDSCRNNPFFARMRLEGSKRALSRGLARPPEPLGGELIAYATREGDVADDGEGTHSPFTAAFLQHVLEPGLEVGFLFRRIRASVLKSTGGEQDPATYGSLSDTPLFFSDSTDQPPSPLGEAARAWAEIKELKDTAVFEAFRTQYGSSNALYGKLAAQKVEELKPSKAASKEEPSSSWWPWASRQRAEPGGAPAKVALAAPPKPVVSDDACDGLLVSVAQASAPPCIRPGSGVSFKDCPDCPEMVIAPSGSFIMGSPGGGDYEGPQHKVTILKPFAVGQFAITRGQFAKFVNATGHNTDGDCETWTGSAWPQQTPATWRSAGFSQEDDHPVVCVSWNDAKAYVAWLSTNTGASYRLLSEAEREYVARAGTTTPFWWGASITTEQANYDGTEVYAGGTKGEYRARTLPVKSLKPNPWGLYQVHGNAFDWVEDCWHDSYIGAPTDGSAWTAGQCKSRLIRGGSWDSYPWILRSAYRRDVSFPEYRYNLIGFRVARTLNP